MRVLTIIVALCGILSFLSLPAGLFSSGSAPWPVLLAYSVFGAFLIWIAVGIWKRRLAAWRFGFVAIVLCTVDCIVEICFALPDVSTVQKFIIIISSLVGGILVAAFWSFIWYRQKNWFAHETVA
jgi:hypothetical protein